MADETLSNAIKVKSNTAPSSNTAELVGGVLVDLCNRVRAAESAVESGGYDDSALREDIDSNTANIEAVRSDVASNYVKKAGDTMSGSLTLPTVIVESISITKSSGGCLFVDGDIVASGGITAYGTNSKTPSGVTFDKVAMWEALAASSSDQINIAHLTSVLASYALKTDIPSLKTLTIKRGGTAVASYDGSEDVTANISLPTFSEVQSKPTTLSGYGITDAYTKTTVDNSISTVKTTVESLRSDVASNYVKKAGDTMSGSLTLPTVIVESISITKSSGGCLFVDGDIVASGGITAYGTNSKTPSGVTFDKVAMWEALAASSSDQINIAHLTSVLASYALKTDIPSLKTLTIKRGGTAVASYDGSEDVTANISLPTFSEVQSKPTTLSGYGITDAYTKTAADSAISTAKTAVTKTLTVQRGGTAVGTYNGTEAKTINIKLPTFSEVQSKPTTLSGYGITDAYTKTAADSAISTAKASAVSTASSDATTKANSALSSAKSYTQSYATPLTHVKSWYTQWNEAKIGVKFCTLTLKSMSARAVLLISGKTGWNYSNSGAVYMFQLSQNYSSSDGNLLGISGSMLVNTVTATAKATTKQSTANTAWRLIAKRIAASKYELYWVTTSAQTYTRFHYHFLQTDNWTIDTTQTLLAAADVPTVDNSSLGVMEVYIARTPDANNYGALTGSSISNSGEVSTATLKVSGASTLTGAVTAGSSITATGNIVSKAAVTAYSSSSSDSRLKKEVRPMRDGMAVVRSLRPVRFKWNDKAARLTEGGVEDGTDGVGFIAQEAEEVDCPGLVFEMPGCDFLGMRYEKIVPALVGAVQELAAEVESLKKRING